ncbi:hypothetical protein HDU90_004667 [Geranomyces variabilis]|nr:hypothetical protein HDU90_004667 [Geranomyces variabilis]
MAATTRPETPSSSLHHRPPHPSNASTTHEASVPEREQRRSPSSHASNRRTPLSRRSPPAATRVASYSRKQVQDVQLAVQGHNGVLCNVQVLIIEIARA